MICVSNSPLCNSSLSASTVVLERESYKKVLRLERTPVFVCVCPGYSFKWTCAGTLNKMREHGCERSDERVRYRIRALLHLAEAPSARLSVGRTERRTKRHKNKTTLQTPTTTQAAFIKPLLKQTRRGTA